MEHPNIEVLTRNETHPGELIKSADAIGIMDFLTAGFIGLMEEVPVRFLCETKPNIDDINYAPLYDNLIDENHQEFTNNLIRSIEGDFNEEVIKMSKVARECFGWNKNKNAMEELRKLINSGLQSN